MQNLLSNYINVLIKNHYISSKTKNIRILFTSSNSELVESYHNFKPIIENKNIKRLVPMKAAALNVPYDSERSDLLKNVSFLDLPVNSIKVSYKVGTTRRIRSMTIREYVDSFRGRSKVSYEIKPTIPQIISRIFIDDKNKEEHIKNIDSLVTISFECVPLPKVFTNSFLYKEEILSPAIYYTLRKFGNTILSYKKYDKAMNYISKHEWEFNGVLDSYVADIETNHYNILVKEYEKVLELPEDDSYAIYRIDTAGLPYYVIDSERGRMHRLAKIAD